MLVVATKRDRRPRQWSATQILCVNLSVAPTTMAQAYSMAQEIAAVPANSQQGLLTHGQYTRMSQKEAGFPWGAVGNSNNELTAVGNALLIGEAYNPIMLATHQLSIPMTTLGDISETGPTHHTIGYAKGSSPLGAFEWTLLTELEAKPSQQAMWEANSTTQRTINAEPTHGGIIVDERLAKQMVQRRSH